MIKERLESIIAARTMPIVEHAMRTPNTLSRLTRHGPFLGKFKDLMSGFIGKGTRKRRK